MFVAGMLQPTAAASVESAESQESLALMVICGASSLNLPGLGRCILHTTFTLYVFRFDHRMDREQLAGHRFQNLQHPPFHQCLCLVSSSGGKIKTPWKVT